MTSRPTRAEKKAETRERLLAAAERIAVEHGFARITMDGVAEAAGLTKGAVYSNFGSKADLLLEVISRMTVGLDLTPAAWQGESVAAILDRMATALIKAARSRSKQLVFAIEFEALVLRDPKLRRAVVQQDAAGRREGDPLIEWLRMNSDELSLPVDEFIELVNALAWGLVLRRLVYGERAIPDHLFRWAFTRFLASPRQA